MHNVPSSIKIIGLSNYLIHVVEKNFKDAILND